ncbi:DUF423 domain-containing protein [Arenimonas donghaensis]|uniref:DUF423 domain-containing protein n=1 Tax=Arenimonas donghaensis DSM 18148 = HO3-R19 TaxID=1121014 RepID=A0A087MHS0_9GAMM|nr:DUF423 domain-containing protein [Arenimonas donghaensis]KFL36423.1 hypothetical protein N788_13070 [Arenimonas donghaensis DSM 18148 = HO3-R19]
MPAATLAPRLLAACGALACGLAVALGAYASHGLEGQAASRAGLASLFSFGHGLALFVLMRDPGRLRLAAGGVLLAGLLLFAGSLCGAVFLGWPTRLAPFGGLLLMAGWLMIAVDALRR